jgi:hypothetical protein
MRVFVRASFTADPNYTGVDTAGLDMLVRTIRLANRHGDVPTLWVTPYHPYARQFLPDTYFKRDARFRRAISDLRRDDPKLRFTFVDLDDPSSFGADDNAWFDGIHMMPANTAKVIDELQRRGVLAPAKTTSGR